ncbi:MAG TPA: SDR family oxidoreductase [Gordonia sp. (in: high G+C Gram-positive bacteria)]|uniref:SDR family NAD(P)-dependent oxidoreductase n=1 Tax=unclassified Gordonia (in: high G+C Gram-positive bacteria) TaxID=2657482 RepID=UPI000F9BE265|nr:MULTISPECIES: SDR family oxidoreductase [unclassified Gordonia (in: high G+C Gram-positive bacteria)]RUP40032.1 MAG: SDR family oxidoreductase [Gordonia sp. (in: high G+C Gram-positive bacteria)]HNP56605.1 SDR family oxidoreductase [Gordonia sp. (in: high G+C Gram-positive bacteria)]HRC49694.1 SDR family oxidoreductase [Gordonia sp. (in: high G+C Gram-positive bacteria)]
MAATGSPETCVVVGATGAMGSAITSSLVAKGFRVVAVARDAAALDELGASSELVVACPADIASDDAVATIKRALDTPVRMAVFAAGLPVRGSADAIDPSALAVAANIKVAGTVRLLHAVRDHLVAGSRFVAIAGSLGIEPGPLDAGPGTANAALINLMRQLSALYGPNGVTTHTIAPGPVDTPRLRALIETQSAESGTSVDELWERYRAKTTLGRLPTLDEIAWLVGLLVEPQASVLHGAVLAADGGVRHGVL